jgi:hypothetical protein
MADLDAQPSNAGSHKSCKVCGEPVPISRKSYCSDRCLMAKGSNKGRTPPPFVGSYDLLPEHLKKFIPGDPRDCWIWEGHRTKTGYPSATSVNTFKGAAYRLIYMMMVGPVRPCWHLHHICENGPGGCVNPHHLMPLAPGAHITVGDSPHGTNARKTHCKNGHEFTPENTITHTNGYGRRCLTCHRARVRAAWEKNREKYRANARRRYAEDPRVREQQRERQRRARERKRAEREAS